MLFFSFLGIKCGLVPHDGENFHTMWINNVKKKDDFLWIIGFLTVFGFLVQSTTGVCFNGFSHLHKSCLSYFIIKYWEKYKQSNHVSVERYIKRVPI